MLGVRVCDYGVMWWWYRYIHQMRNKQLVSYIVLPLYELTDWNMDNPAPITISHRHHYISIHIHTFIIVSLEENMRVDIWYEWFMIWITSALSSESASALLLWTSNEKPIARAAYFIRSLSFRMPVHSHICRKDRNIRESAADSSLQAALGDDVSMQRLGRISAFVWQPRYSLYTWYTCSDMSTNQC